jgi:transcriptional regulator with XRE-family HTH domain
MHAEQCCFVKIVLPAIFDDNGRRMSFADGVKEIRAKFGLSTEQLAQECGVSRRTVEGWEQGRPLREAALKLLARYYDRQRRAAHRILRRRQQFE